MKIVVLVPFFGSFNSYFGYWLKSCINNSNISWVIITDQAISKDKLDDADNIRVVNTEFSNLKRVFRNKLGPKTLLNKPYKLCDFKPLYGYLFQEYLENCDFWGYCDMDVVFGRILDLLPTGIFEKYDKILTKGHLSFIRNKPEINENFFYFDTYKVITSSPAAYGFDEVFEGYHKGFGWELESRGFQVYKDVNGFSDIDFRDFPFKDINHDMSPSVFTWVDGRLNRYVKKPNDTFETSEIMYAHFQKRKLTVITEARDILIAPNTIDEFDENKLNNDEFWRMSTESNSKYHSKLKEKKYWLMNDITKWVYEPNKIESLAHRIRKQRYS